MKKLTMVVTLGMALLTGACGDDSGNNNNNQNATPHLGGAAVANGVCDNPSEAPNTCYEYIGSTFSGTGGQSNCTSSQGTYSKTAGCGSSGRGGRCTLFAGTANEYIAHCYQSAATCQQQCEGAGTFQAN